MNEGMLIIENVTGVIVAHFIIYLTNIIHTFEEALPVLDFRLAPLHLTECGKTRKEHVFKMAVSGDIFSPQVGLHSDNVGFLLFAHALLERLV